MDSNEDNKRKASAGTVVIVADKDNRLRLRWSHAGKRYDIAIGMPESEINRKIVRMKADAIEMDIKSGHFDLTLARYRTPAALRPNNKPTNGPTAVELFDRFTDYKRESLDPRTIENYSGTRRMLLEFFGDKLAEHIGRERAWELAVWMVGPKGETGAGLAHVTAKEKLVLLRAAWGWATEPHRRIVEANVWAEAVERFKVPPMQRPRPFSRQDMERIEAAFRADPYYSHYTDYVRFLLKTGVRTGEAIGLQWQHVAEDCSWVWIGESVSKGVRKTTKTGKARILTMTAVLQDMLCVRRSIAPGKAGKPDPDALVFSARKGGTIDPHNFCNRAWKTILSRLDIDYRRPYNTRHSLVSNALDMGMSPLDVAALTGHNVRTLYTFYAGHVNSRPRLPEM